MHAPHAQQKSLRPPFTMYNYTYKVAVHACYMQQRPAIEKPKSHPPCVRLWEGAAQYLTESGRKAARLNAQVSFILCFTF